MIGDNDSQSSQSMWRVVRSIDRRALITVALLLLLVGVASGVSTYTVDLSGGYESFGQLQDNEFGVVVELDWAGTLEVQPSSKISGGETIYLYDTDLNLVNSKSYDTSGVEFDVPSRGEYVVAVSINSTGSHALDNSASFPHESGRIKVTSGYASGDPDPKDNPNLWNIASLSTTGTEIGPVIDNSSASPSGGATVQESPVELSINVSDADLGTSQGDSVDVTFYDASDDSEIGNDTLTANGTATASWGSVTGGENNWYAVATDSYGNSVTSQTFAFNAPNELEIRALDTKKLITEDSNGDPINVEVQFFGGEGAVATRNTTDGTVSMTGLPVDQRFAVNVDAGDGYVSRQILITSLIEHQTAYLLNNSANVETVSPRFVLEDPSNQFDTEESEIILERPIEVNGTTEFVPVAGDRIGLNGFDTTLEKGQRYRVTVRDPSSGSERRLGEFTPTVSEKVTLTVQDVEFNSVSKVDGIEWTAQYVANEDNADEIKFLYRDADTASIDYQIYERGNESNVLASGSATGNVTATETVPAGEENTVWVVEWSSTLDNGERLSGSRQVSSGQLPVGPGLAPEWQTALAMVGLFVIAGLFGAANPAIGGIAVASTGGFFWMLGWLPDGTSGLMVLLALFVAVLSYSARKARGATA